MEDSDWIAEQQRLIEPYRIADDSPRFPEGSVVRSLDDAIKVLRRELDCEFEFDPNEVVEAENWWYIPYGWVGCSGFIVDKLDGYINQLGSCYQLDLCFWAHNQGIKYTYANLTILQVHNLENTVATLLKMGNRAPLNPIPNKSDSGGNRTKFFNRTDIENHLQSLPVTFENQHLWFTIRALKKAYDANDFEFEVTRGSWDKSAIL